MTPETTSQPYAQLEAAARALVDAQHTHRSGEPTIAARLQLEVALLTLEQRRMLADIEGYQRTNSALQLEIARLEQLNAIQATQIVALADEAARARATQPVAPLPFVPDDAPPSFVCPDCGAGFAKPKGLAMHRQRAHRPPVAPETPDAAPVESPALVERLTLAADDPHWRCATCGRAEGQPFARSVADPAVCAHCLKAPNGAAAHTNGVHT